MWLEGYRETIIRQESSEDALHDVIMYTIDVKSHPYGFYMSADELS